MTGKPCASLYDEPKKGVFCGPGKYLRVIKHEIKERMFPIMEDDSFFLLIRSGSGKFTINGVSFDVSRGSSAWIQCTHALTVEPDYGSTLEIWSIMYDYQLSNFLMFRKSSPKYTERTVTTYGFPIIGASGDIAKKIWDIFTELESLNKPGSSGEALIKVSLLGRMSLLFSLYNSRVETFSDSQYPLGWRACIYIASHSINQLEAEQVAQALDTNVLTLNRQLRMCTGLNFEQMVNRCRCILAASFFLCENLPLDYMALRVGFKSEVTFYRCFKKTMGMTPSEYRDLGLSNGKDGVFRGMIMDDRLISIINYLYENATEPIALNDIAKGTYVSVNIVRRLCSEAFGMSYKDILALFRVRHSEALLAATDLPLLDISVIVGFNSVRTFSRVFTAINGQTPSEYRAGMKGNGVRNGKKTESG